MRTLAVRALFPCPARLHGHGIVCLPAAVPPLGEKPRTGSASLRSRLVLDGSTAPANRAGRQVRLCLRCAVRTVSMPLAAGQPDPTRILSNKAAAAWQLLFRRLARYLDAGATPIGPGTWTARICRPPLRTLIAEQAVIGRRFKHSWEIL